MTSEAIDDDARGAVATIAESFPARVTVMALREADISPHAVANNFPAYLTQKLPMVEAHVDRLPNAVLVLRLRALEEWGRPRGFLRAKGGDGAMSERQ